MYRAVQRISRFWIGLFAGGASLSMATMFLIVFVNSIRRYAIGKSFEWGEELPVFIAVYGIMFGMAYAYLQDRHIRFTMLVGFLPERLTRYLFMLVDLIMVGSGIMLTWSGYLFVLKRGRMESSGMINLAKDLKQWTGIDQMIWLGQMSPYQSAMILGGALLTIAAIIRLARRCTEPVESATEEG